MTPMELRAMARAGVTIREQAETFGVSASAICARRKELGIRHVHAWRQVPVGTLRSGRCAAEIARRTGWLEHAVREAARREGITLPDGRDGSHGPARDEARHAAARKMRAAGNTFAAIGAELGVSRQRAHQMCRRKP